MIMKATATSTSLAVAGIAVLLLAILLQHPCVSSIVYIYRQSCHQHTDPLVEWTLMLDSSSDFPQQSPQNISVQPCDVFSATYSESREKFLNAALRGPNGEAGVAVATYTSLPINAFTVSDSPIVDSTTPEYFIDVAVVKGKRSGFVVHVSGTHGVEGFAGSAVQIAFLKGINENMLYLLPTIILVHAFNPVGMASFRRANENNVSIG